MDVRLPDFIIGGAPKCGTTSLHFILKQHPDVGIPDNEILFYDADDPIAHNDFLHVHKRDLVWFDPDYDPKAFDWYASRFLPFAEKKTIGEDSPTYLFSEVAAQRIASRAPQSKLIFTLRHPVSRAYSQYWHLVRSGRATSSFEQTIIQHSSIILGSTYTPHLKRFLATHDPDRVLILVFEDFAKEPQAVVNRITEFLDLSPLDVAQAEVQFNRSIYPWSQTGQRLVNRVGQHVVARRYRNHMGQDDSRSSRAFNKFHYRWFRYINPLFLGAEKAPRMRDVTRAFLEQHLSARNAGLSELLGRDMSAIWPGLRI